MVKVILNLTVWLLEDNIFKRYERVVNLPITPTPGLVVDGGVIEYVFVNTTAGTIKCMMEGIDACGDADTFNAMCEDLIDEGWSRV